MYTGPAGAGERRRAQNFQLHGGRHDGAFLGLAVAIKRENHRIGHEKKLYFTGVRWNATHAATSYTMTWGS